MATWNDWNDQWNAGWKALQEEGVRQYGAAIQADPRAFAPQVEKTLESLKATRARLDSMKAASQGTPTDSANFSRLSVRYYELAAGVYGQSDQASAAIGAPVLLVVLGVGLVLGAIAWALVSWKYVAELEQETKVVADELRARIALNREGTQLQPSTLEWPRASSPAGSIVPLALGGVLAIVAGLVAWKTLNPQGGGA